MHVTGLYFPTGIGYTRTAQKFPLHQCRCQVMTLPWPALLSGRAGLFTKLGFYFALGCELPSRFRNRLHGRASLGRAEAESDDTLKKRL